MNTFSNNNTTGGIIGFPAHDVDPAKKLEKSWNVQYCQAIYSLYRNNLTGIGQNDKDLFELYRAYGNGNQSETQYMDRLGISKKATPNIPNQATSDDPVNNQPSDGARKGYMNINWKILSVAPNFKNIVLGTFEDVEHDIFADGVDEVSSTKREEMKWNLWMENTQAEYLKEIEKTVGIEFKKSDYIPKTLQELQMFADLGGFKLRSEIAIEEALRYTMSISEWKEIKRKVIEDLYECGKGITKDYLDPMTQKVKVRYVDVARSVIPYSQQQGYTNMPFGGEFTFYDIADLRATNKLDGTPQFTEEELRDIATQNVGLWGNPNSWEGTGWEADSFGRYGYDRFKVTVLDCEFLSDDFKYMTERTTADGKKVVHQDKFGKVRKSDNKKTHITKTLMVYKCKWIVGTEYAWDYGHQFDIPRPTPSEARLSFHAYDMKAGSFIKRMIPLLDSIQLSWLKLQNAKAKAAPSGLAVEMGSLNNVTIGNKKLAPLDVLKIRNQTGDLLYQATTHRTFMPSQTNYKPVQELQGGLGAQGMEYLGLISADIEQIRGIIGINKVADASSPSSDQLVGVSEISLQATATALKPIYSAYITIKERMCKNVALRIQLIVKFNKSYELSYFKAFGKSITETLKIGSEVNNAMFGIRIEARPSQQEKQQILETAQAALQVGKQGSPLISYGDWMMVQNFVNLGMLKFARAFIAHREQMAQEKMDAKQEEAITLQGQQNKELEMIKSQQAQAALEAELNKIKIEADEKRKTLTLEHTNKMEELAFTKSQDLQKEVVKKSMENAQDDKRIAVEKEAIESNEEIKEQEIDIKEKQVNKPTPQPTSN
jgi:surface antigen